MASWKGVIYLFDCVYCYGKAGFRSQSRAREFLFHSTKESMVFEMVSTENN
jgi:hypothetical protein